jgi:hypothetical protein
MPPLITKLPAGRPSPSSARMFTSMAMASAGWPSTAAEARHGHQLAVLLHHHAQGVQVDVFHVARPAAAHKAGRRAVVGHHAGQVELEAGEARIDDLHRRQHVVGGVQHVLAGAAGALQGLLHHEGHLAFDAGVHQVGGGDGRILGTGHAVGEKADGGHIDAHLDHLGLRGQARLPAHLLVTGRQEALPQRHLHGVAVTDGHARVFVGELGDGVGAGLGTFDTLAQAHDVLAAQGEVHAGGAAARSGLAARCGRRGGSGGALPRKLHPAAAQAADGAHQFVAIDHRHQGRLRSRQDHLAGLEGNAQLAQGVGQPGHRVGGRTLHRGTDTGGKQLAVLLQHHAGQGEVQPARIALGLAQHIHAAGGVVRHRVLDLDLPVGDARIDDLETGQHVVGGADHVHGGDARALQILLEHKGQLGLGLGLDEPAEVDGVAFGVNHARQQDAEIGLIHAQEILHRLAGGADLLADHFLAGSHAAGHEALLDAVGVGDGDVRLTLQQRADGTAAERRLRRARRRTVGSFRRSFVLFMESIGADQSFTQMLRVSV